VDRIIVAVEGVSDRNVLEQLARRCGRDLRAEGIEIVPIGGAHAIRRFVEALAPGTVVRGLCDENEAHLFRRVLAEVHVCVPDLEGELIRALGVDRVLSIVDTESFRRMQRQPAQRGRPVDKQLHRWLRSSSTRFHCYLPRLVEALDLDRVPQPLDAVLGNAPQPG
jgi:hypothetical protein